MILFSFFAEINNYCISINGIMFELYEGVNKKPCYFKDGKYNYLDSSQSLELTTVKAVTTNKK